MRPTPLTEVARVLGAEMMRVDGAALALGASVDSRATRSGELFFALRGRTDGAAFAPDALQSGAVAVVADRPLEVPTLVVEDPLVALQELAKWSLANKSERRPEVVGITGSVGKTTTKDALAAILRTSGKKVCATEGNFNNEIGLPLTVLSASEQTETLVLEMGATHAGDIAHLCEIAPPQVGVLTAVAPVHLDTFGSLERVAVAKGELALAVPDDGAFVGPSGVPETATGYSRNFARRWTFARGGGDGANLWASEIEQREKDLCFKVHAEGATARTRTPAFGTHLVEPLLAAIGGALSLGLSLEECVQGVSCLKRTGLRGEVYRLKNDVVIYDDSYNASPTAMAAVLRYAADQARRENRRLVAVLGGMFELGPDARAYHTKTGELSKELGVDLLVGVGEEARWYAESFPGETLLYRDALSAAGGLCKALQGGEYVVVKGSRGVKLDTLTRIIRDRLTLV